MSKAVACQQKLKIIQMFKQRLPYFFKNDDLDYYFQAKKLVCSDEKMLGVSERLLAGSMAGVASQTSIYPLEVGS